MQTQRSTGWRVLSDYGGPFHTGLSGKNACSFRSLRRGPKLTAARRRSIQMIERPLEASRGHVTHTPSPPSTLGLVQWSFEAQLGL
jgi:hypothetical protein